jgi:hypothetical protein
MRFISILGLSLFVLSCNSKNNDNSNAQTKNTTKPIECKNIRLLEGIIDTDTTTFDIGTKLFWKYNCDSAWLTYINHKQEHIILDCWKDNPELAVKMGLYYLHDFQKSILFEKKVISGCCDLPDNLIIDKKTGVLVKNIGPIIWYSVSRKYPLILSFEESDNATLGFKKMVVHNLDNNKKFYFSLINYEFFKGLKEQYFKYKSNLLKDFEVNNNILTLTFRKELLSKRGQFINQVIKINLNEYCT